MSTSTSTIYSAAVLSISNKLAPVVIYFGDKGNTVYNLTEKFLGINNLLDYEDLADDDDDEEDEGVAGDRLPGHDNKEDLSFESYYVPSELVKQLLISKGVCDKRESMWFGPIVTVHITHLLVAEVFEHVNFLRSEGMLD